MSISVKMFPAGCGESFLLNIGASNILIDGGFSETYESFIKEHFVQLARRQERLDVVVVTHIDQDHLLGILSFIKENGHASTPQIIPVNDVWYNCYSSLPWSTKSPLLLSSAEKDILKSYLYHRSSSQNDPQQISGVQGMGLTYHLVEGGYAINKAFDNSTIDTSVPELRIGEDINIQVISPSKAQLKNLVQHWHSELKKKRWAFNITNDPLFNQAMEAYLLYGYACFETYTEPIAITKKRLDIEKLLKIQTSPDCSIINASSIAFIIKSKGKRLLFLGDAHEEQILSELNRLNLDTGEVPFFDLIKVPHHGSLKNCQQLFDKIDGGGLFLTKNKISRKWQQVPAVAHLSLGF